jgi:hypothetical protein
MFLVFVIAFFTIIFGLLMEIIDFLKVVIISILGTALALVWAIIVRILGITLNR